MCFWRVSRPPTAVPASLTMIQESKQHLCHVFFENRAACDSLNLQRVLAHILRLASMGCSLYIHIHDLSAEERRMLCHWGYRLTVSSPNHTRISWASTSCICQLSDVPQGEWHAYDAATAQCITVLSLWILFQHAPYVRETLYLEADWKPCCAQTLVGHSVRSPR